MGAFLFTAIFVFLPYVFGVNLAILAAFFLLKRKKLVKWYFFALSTIVISIGLGVLYAGATSGGFKNSTLEVGFWLGALGSGCGFVWWYLLVFKGRNSNANET